MARIASRPVIRWVVLTVPRVGSVVRFASMRVMLALGGNAMTNAEGRARPEDQIAAARVAMAAVADLLTRPGDPVEVVVTHGNGPQVGNLLVKNELAASVVPPVPLDWCGAQTQATLGFILLSALDEALARRGTTRRSAALVTRARVDADDHGFARPTKPIGRFLTRDEARTMIEHGEVWEDRGEKGWRADRRLPGAAGDRRRPRRPDAAGGRLRGGRQRWRRHPRGPRTGAAGWRGVEAVIDKDLGAALLARTVARRPARRRPPTCRTPCSASAPPTAEPTRPGPRLGSCARTRPRVTSRAARWGRRSTPSAASSSSGGARAVITDLAHIVDAVHGRAGTVVVPDRSSR